MRFRAILHSTLLLAALVGMIISPALGQSPPKYYNIWYFGYGAGVTFNGSAAPNALLDGKTASMEGCATICDPVTGELLFYTDGITVWNARHEIMKNGEGLQGHMSSTQAALIVPSPGDSSIFYIFTTGALHDGLNDALFGFCYSIVDIRIDGGLGAVMDKNIPLFRNSTEKITATRHCNGRDYWVVTHEWGTNNFRSYLVDRNGVSHTPVISSSGLLYPYSADTISTSGFGAGMIKLSPNGRKLAAANWQGEVAELFAFDNRTGIVSNPITLQAPAQIYYGASFSPDNSKLYITGIARPSSILQFDLSSNDPETIAGSMKQIPIPSEVSVGGLQLGPDGRIYAALPDRASLSVITHPNLPGANCDFIHDEVSLEGRSTLQGLSYCIDYNLLPPPPAVMARGHDFGRISGCTDSTGAVMLISDCGGIREIVSIGLDPSSRFSIAPPGSPLRLFPGDTLRLPVLFTPRGSGRYNDTAKVIMAILDGVARFDTVEILLGGIADKHAVPARVARNYKVFPGHTLRTPVELQTPIDDARIQRLRITFTFDSTFIHLMNGNTPDDLLVGTLLQGWRIESFEKGHGRIRITVKAPDNSTYLHGSGPILNPELQAFLTPRITSELDAYVEVLDRECAAIYTTAGYVRIDSLCAMEYRMMERLSSYTQVVLEQNRPNPVTSITSITFIAPAGGHARLQILDSRGLPVATLVDGVITPGKHEVTWDASHYPNGFYLCQLQLEDQMRTMWMSVMK